MERGYRYVVATIGAHRLHHARIDDATAVDPVSLEACWTGWSRALCASLDRQVTD